MVEGLIKEPKDVEAFKGIIHLAPLDLETAEKLYEMTEELYKHPEWKNIWFHQVESRLSGIILLYALQNIEFPI